MTAEQFFTRLELGFAKNYSNDQKALFTERLLRFSDRELGRICNDLLDHAKRLPNLADILDSARSMNMITDTEFRPHQWSGTDCALCAGEGRILVTWEMEFDEHRREMCRLVRIRPYSAPGTAIGCGEYQTLFRCCCSAGEASGLQNWPSWKPHLPAVRCVSRI